MFSHVMFLFFNATVVVFLAAIITIYILRKNYAPFIKEKEKENEQKNM